MPPGVNFINILQAAFTLTDPKSAKRQSSCQSLLRFLAKAALRILMKLTPGDKG